MNQELISQFRILQDYYRKQGDKGRAIAYGRAIPALQTIRERIVSLDQVQKIRGLGPKIQAKIEEFLRSGQIKEVEAKRVINEQKSEKERILDQFETIWGIGPSKAVFLYDQGLRSLSHLEKQKHLLNVQQKIGLKYRRELGRKIPRLKISALLVIFVCLLNKKYGEKSFQLDIAGSYRRGLKNSSDVDCLISSSCFTLKDAVDLFIQNGIVTDILSLRTVKFMGVAHCPSEHGSHFRLDIEFVSSDEWGSALLYFTGSKNFNIFMRSEAKRKGFILNEHGLFSAKKKLLSRPTEKDIFRFLGIRFVPPNER
jgi:DNA polymerase/3'-5' exonuclease PolX